MQALNDNVMKYMTIGQVFKKESRVNSLDFFRDGESMIASTDGGEISYFSVNDGQQTRQFLSTTYGVDLVRFTHARSAVIHASNNSFDDSIRYLSIHDNTYLEYFRGHTDRVVDLQISPINDTFLSASLDYSLRMWDLRTATCQAILKKKTVTHGTSLAIDPQGLLFAATFPENTVKLFDFRELAKGPFSTFALKDSINYDFTGIKISPDGKWIILTTLQGDVLVVDSFEGKLHTKLMGVKNESSTVMEACVTPDSRYVLAGSEDGSVIVWSMETGEEVVSWSGHPAPVGRLRFNPTMTMAASACTNIAFWMPGPAKEETSTEQQQESSSEANNEAEN